MKIVTIWKTYGAYHLARAKAITDVFTDASVTCFSHCASDRKEYPFFKDKFSNHEVIVDCDDAELDFKTSFQNTFRLLSHYQPDLILTCGYERPESLASVVYAKTKAAKVFLMLDNQIDDSPRKWLIERTKSLYLQLFDGFLIGGNTHLDYLKHLGVASNKVAFGYNCVDNHAIALCAEKIRQDIPAPEINYFLCVSRLIEKKNIPALLNAYVIYKQSVLDSGDRQPWQLLICGDGSLKDNLIAQISAMNLSDHVSLLGRIDDIEELVRYYTFARALILPSHHNEQWGLVVNEAMAARLPVIVSKQCGCSQHLVEDGVNGFRFDGYSVHELATHMLWMHNNQTLLADMGEKSWGIVQRYTPNHFAHNVKTLYESVR
jgi:1,2-diacylglycerol 3-alpha-glucosyltransferase